MDKHIHFDGCGGLYCYQIGIASIIAEKYYHINNFEDVFISGTSVG